MYHAHNLYLNILAETGIPGFAIIPSSYRRSCYYICSFERGYVPTSCTDRYRRFSYRSSFSGLSDFELYSHQVTIVFGNSLVGWGLCESNFTKAHM